MNPLPASYVSVSSPSENLSCPVSNRLHALKRLKTTYKGENLTAEAPQRLIMVQTENKPFSPLANPWFFFFFLILLISPIYFFSYPLLSVNLVLYVSYSVFLLFLSLFLSPSVSFPSPLFFAFNSFSLIFLPFVFLPFVLFL